MLFLRSKEKLTEIYGSAIVFDYPDVGKDIIWHKASIRSKLPLPMKFEHGPTIGTWNRCSVTRYGLLIYGFINSELAKSQLHQHIYEGKIKLSAGFYIMDYHMVLINRVKYRIISKLVLSEVSLTKNPANDLCGCIATDDSRFLQQEVNNEYKR